MSPKCVSAHEEGNFRAEDDTGGGQDCKSPLVSAPSSLDSQRTLKVREKITQGQSRYPVSAVLSSKKLITDLPRPNAKKFGNVREA